MLLQKLLIRKKLTAVFADGSLMSNLGVPRVVEMLKGTPALPVELAEDERASELLAELAFSSQRAILQQTDGLALVPVPDEPQGEAETPEAETPEARGTRRPCPLTRRRS